MHGVRAGVEEDIEVDQGQCGVWFEGFTFEGAHTLSLLYGLGFVLVLFHMPAPGAWNMGPWRPFLPPPDKMLGRKSADKLHA